MVSRHFVIYLLFFVVVGTMGVLSPRATQSAPAVQEGPVPPEALQALREGRYLRASLILREYLAERRDSTPGTLLLAARAEAGWGDWERVRQLLEGRSWLDREAAGYGWNLLGQSQLQLGRYQQGSASLARYLSMADTAGAEREQAIAQLRRAEALVEQKKVTEALDAYDHAAALLPQLSDWIHVFAASAAAHAGDTTTVRTRLALVDSTVAQEWAWRTPIRAQQQAGDTRGAIAAAERAAARLPAASRRIAAWTLAGTLRAERGDAIGARNAYRRALQLADGASTGVEAARLLSAMSDVAAADQLLIGRTYLRNGNVARGVAGLTAYMNDGGATDTEKARIRYDIANAQFRAGENAAAEKLLLEVAASSGDRRAASDALYTAARAQYRDGRVPVARATLARIIRDFADQPAAVRAAYLSADLDHDAEKLTEAAELYRQAIRLGPSTEEAGIARMRLAGIAISQDRYEDALREVEEYRNTHRSGSSYQQATYWSAVALQRLDRGDEARARFTEAARLDPFSYYGGQAAAALEQDLISARLEPSPAESERFEQEVQRALSRVDLLREIGWNEAANYEMERVRRHFARYDGALYTLAEALNERGFTNAGINLGWEIRRREGAWNARLLRIVYPFPFRNVIVAEARDRDVDPYLAAALIRQESMFNPSARSPVGALGLMQVMPQTGATLARRLGVSRFNPDMLTRPELNVHFGMAYLADQLRTWGRLDAVLAAYNAGPTRVARWRDFPEYEDRLLFAERIPYEETRDYVRIVQNNQRIYRLLYSGQDGAAATD